MVKFQARLAGAKIDDDRRSRKIRRSSKKDEDEYGKILEFRKRMKEAENEFADFSDCMKPL